MSTKKESIKEDSLGGGAEQQQGDEAAHDPPQGISPDPSDEVPGVEEKKNVEVKEDEGEGGERKEEVKEEVVNEEGVKEEAVNEEGVKEEVLNEERVKEEVVNEEVAEEQAANGEMVKEEVLNEEVTEEQEANGEMVKEEVLNEEMTEEQEANRGVVKEEEIKEEVLDEGVIKEEALEEVVNGEVAQEGEANGGVVKEEGEWQEEPGDAVTANDGIEPVVEVNQEIPKEEESRADKDRIGQEEEEALTDVLSLASDGPLNAVEEENLRKARNDTNQPDEDQEIREEPETAPTQRLRMKSSSKTVTDWQRSSKLRGSGSMAPETGTAALGGAMLSNLLPQIPPNWKPEIRPHEWKYHPAARRLRDTFGLQQQQLPQSSPSRRRRRHQQQQNVLCCPPNQKLLPLTVNYAGPDRMRSVEERRRIRNEYCELSDRVLTDPNPACTVPMHPRKYKKMTWLGRSRRFKNNFNPRQKEEEEELKASHERALKLGYETLVGNIIFSDIPGAKDLNRSWQHFLDSDPMTWGFPYLKGSTERPTLPLPAPYLVHQLKENLWRWPRNKLIAHSNSDPAIS